MAATVGVWSLIGDGEVSVIIRGVDDELSIWGFVRVKRISWLVVMRTAHDQKKRTPSVCCTYKNVYELQKKYFTQSIKVISYFKKSYLRIAKLTISK